MALDVNATKALFATSPLGFSALVQVGTLKDQFSQRHVSLHTYFFVITTVFSTKKLTGDRSLGAIPSKRIGCRSIFWIFWHGSRRKDDATSRFGINSLPQTPW